MPSSWKSQAVQQNLISNTDAMGLFNQNVPVGNLTLQNVPSRQPLNGYSSTLTNSCSYSSIGGSSNLSSNLNQSSILMPDPVMVTANKNLNQHQPIYNSFTQQQQQLTHQQQQQQQQLQPPQHQMPVQYMDNPRQQVPMTTIMIPASTASQLQSIASQIQQTALQSSPNSFTTPQIIVFMIPWLNSPQVPSITPVTPVAPATPATPVRPATPVTPVTISRQSNPNSSMMRQSHPQAQQAQQAQRAQQVTSFGTSQGRAETEKFYIRANFTFQPRKRQELAFQRGDILHVLDTLQDTEFGIQYWLATRVKPDGEDADKGLIPNKKKAEEITIEQRTMDISERNLGSSNNLDTIASNRVSRVNFLRRRSAQRSKSLSVCNWDNVVFDFGNFKIQTYERVVLKHPGFCRPVVIFGPLSDLAREKLLKDYPEKYSYPSGISQTPDHSDYSYSSGISHTQDHPKVIRLKGITEIIDQGKHALLDITAQAVERLNQVNLAPIVIFMKTDSKSIIKEFRSRAAQSIDPNARNEDTLRCDGKSSRKLLEQSEKLEKSWFHIFTAVLDLSTMGSEMWYRKLRETIENQQASNVWMREKTNNNNSQISNILDLTRNREARGSAFQIFSDMNQNNYHYLNINKLQGRSPP